MPSDAIGPPFDSAKKTMADLFYTAAQSPLMERLRMSTEFETGGQPTNAEFERYGSDWRPGMEPPSDSDLPTCALCDEPIGEDDPGPEFGQWSFPNHRACALRSVIGGIGHLIAHEYWCLQYHDPDAGLTYRQSALLVDEFVHVVGVEGAVARG